MTQALIKLGKFAPAKYITRYPHEKRVAILKALHSKGFHLFKLWGCSPRDDRRVQIEKNGVLESRLRCFCPDPECKHAGKHPIAGRDKTANRSFRINYDAGVARRVPNLNWAMATGQESGIVVVDIDVGAGGFASLESIKEHFPPTWTVKTGSGGLHLVYKHPGEDWHVKSISNHPNLGAGIDVKGEGGYVVAAGSLHNSGNYYLPEKEIHSADDIQIAELSDWLLSKIAKRKSELPEKAKPLTPEQIAAINARFKELNPQSLRGTQKWAQAVLDGEVDRVLAAPSHSGNETLFQAACNVISKCVETGFISRWDAIAALMGAADARGGKTSGRVARRTIESAEARVRGNPVYPKPSERKSDALDEWFKSNRDINIVAIAKAIPADYLESLDGLNEDHPAFEAALAREHQFQQSDPEGFAAWEAEESERQRNFDFSSISKRLPSAAAQVDQWKRQLNRDGIPPSGLRKYDDQLHDSLKNPEITQKDVKHWHRCPKCIVQRRPCEECGKNKLGVTRQHPGDSTCKRGGQILLQSVSKKHILKKFCPKCGYAGCQVCGYDFECDHLVHYITFGEMLIDHLDSPQLNVPSYRIEDLSTTKVDIQPGVWRVIVHADYARKYSHKLSKLAGKVYFHSDFIGNDTYEYFCLLVPSFDPARLSYRSGDGKEYEVDAERLTFKEYDIKHRQNLSYVGRYIDLTKNEWMLCDAPPGTRKRYNAVNYCRALAMPARFESTGNNNRLGRIVPNDDQQQDILEEIGTDFKECDPGRFDKSGKRGLTRYLIKVGTYGFTEETPLRVISKFIERMLGRDRQITPVSEDPPKQEAGNSCHRLRLIT